MSKLRVVEAPRSRVDAVPHQHVDAVPSDRVASVEPTRGTTAELRAFDKAGLLAINPRAFFTSYLPAPQESSAQVIGNVAVVDVRGPLTQHPGWWTDSYPQIVARVAAACETSADVVILRVDSPGGDVYGCFDAARSIRDRVAAAGKRLVAHVGGEACSAGYALACVASEIVVADTAFVGSIGVLETRVDVTAADRAYGQRFDVVTSGARKADRHPHVALSAEEAASAQARVDSLAAVFFDHVAATRTKLNAASVGKLEAEVFHGAAAVAVGLADSVASFDALLVRLASGETGEAMADESSDLETARKALEKAAEGDGEEAEKAKKALAAMDAVDEDDDETDEEPAASKDDDEPEAAAESPAATASRSAGPSASTSGEIAAALSRAEERIARLEGEADGARKSALFASRPDLTKGLIKILAGKPFAEAKAIVDATPKPNGTNPAAGIQARGTVGGDPEGTPSNASSDAGADMDAKMGIRPSSMASKKEGTRREFGVLTREEAIAKVQKQNAPAVAGK